MKKIFKQNNQNNILPLNHQSRKNRKRRNEKVQDLSSRIGKTVGHYAVKAYQQQSKKEKEGIQDSYKGK